MQAAVVDKRTAVIVTVVAAVAEVYSVAAAVATVVSAIAVAAVTAASILYRPYYAVAVATADSCRTA